MTTIKNNKYLCFIFYVYCIIAAVGMVAFSKNALNHVDSFDCDRQGTPKIFAEENPAAYWLFTTMRLPDKNARHSNFRNITLMPLLPVIVCSIVGFFNTSFLLLDKTTRFSYIKNSIRLNLRI